MTLMCVCVYTSCHVGMYINFMHACIAMCECACAVVHALFTVCMYTCLRVVDRHVLGVMSMGLLFSPCAGS